MKLDKVGQDRQKLLNSNSIQNGKVSNESETKKSEIKKLAKDFESIFIDVVLKSMRETVQKSGFIDGGNAEDMYQSMLDSEYSKLMSQNDGTGLGAMLEKQLLRLENLDEQNENFINKMKAKEAYQQTKSWVPKFDINE